MYTDAAAPPSSSFDFPLFRGKTGETERRKTNRESLGLSSGEGATEGSVCLFVDNERPFARA